MLDGSRHALVKSVKKLNDSLEGELNPALLKDEKGILVFNDSISIEKAMLMIRLLQNRIIAKGLPPFLELYVPGFLPEGAAVSKKDIRQAVKCACDEKHVQTLLYVARHMGEELTLADVTSTVYCKVRAQHSSYRGRVRKNLIPKLGKVGLWESIKSDDDESWTIKSGQTLDAFVTHVFTHWAVRQARFFGEFLRKRGEE